MTATRVLHILPHRGGGGEVYVSMLESSQGFAHKRFYLSGGRTPASAAASLPIRLPELLSQIRAADILHIHGDAAGIIISLLPAVRPSVLTTHGLHLFRRSTGSTMTGVRLGLRRGVARSSVVIATSQSELEDLVPVVRRADRQKLRVILNGVRPPAPITEEERHQIRDSVGVGPGTILGLFAGEMESRKEPLLAAAAAARVRDAGIPFVLVLAGAGPLSTALGRQTSDAVQPLGFRNDLDRLMAASDVFVQPSSREGMSLALLEAMSHGLAVVAADVPGNNEAVSGSGVLFKPGDDTDLAAAITRLCTDAVLRDELARAAHQRSLSVFDVGRFVTETAATYAAALGATSP